MLLRTLEEVREGPLSWLLLLDTDRMRNGYLLEGKQFWETANIYVIFYSQHTF